MKKARNSRFEETGRRVSARLQAKAQMYSQTPPKYSSEVANSVPMQCASLSSRKRLKDTEYVNIRGSESTSLWESDQISSTNTSAELHATIGNLIGSVLSPAQADSPTAPARNVRGRKESDQDALPSVTAKDIGAAVTTIASNTTSGKQVTLEEARVIADVVKEMPKNVNNSMTNDEPSTQSIGLTEIACMFADDGSNEDEVESFLFHPALVSVQGYRVKEASAPILRTVIEKHGDIAMNCIVETAETRSLFLEKICEIIQILQTTKFVDITQVEVKKMLAFMGDLGRLNVDVGWLQKRLEEILEAIELVKQSSQLKERKKRNAQIIQESTRALKSCEASVLVHETQIQALKERASLEKEKIDVAQAEDRIVMQRLANFKPKVKRFIEESLLYDLP